MNIAGKNGATAGTLCEMPPKLFGKYIDKNNETKYYKNDRK
jgi:hypothetical protein